MEGIKADVESDDIRYSIEDGIFKKFSKLAHQERHIAIALSDLNFSDYIDVNQKFNTRRGIEFTIVSIA